MSGLIAVGYFLFALFFSLVSFILWARIALHFFRISSLNQVHQSISRLTNPIISPLNHLFHINKKHPPRYDWPCFTLLVIVELLKFLAIGTLFLGAMLPWSYLPLYTLADLIIEPCNLLFYAIIIRVVMSWVNPQWHHPIADLLRKITDPALHLGRRMIPDISGFDFSPYIVLISLKIITLFISKSLPIDLI